MCAIIPTKKPTKKHQIEIFGTLLKALNFKAIAFNTLPIKIKPNHALL
jgi:hypothetical protein